MIKPNKKDEEISAIVVFRAFALTAVYKTSILTI
jgi:hypothetical protein